MKSKSRFCGAQLCVFGGGREGVWGKCVCGGVIGEGARARAGEGAGGWKDGVICRWGKTAAPPIHTARHLTAHPPRTHAPPPQPPPPGAKPEREEWEIPFYFTLAGVALVCLAAATSKKPTPHAWARDEVEERERRCVVALPPHPPPLTPSSPAPQFRRPLALRGLCLP